MGASKSIRLGQNGEKQWVGEAGQWEMVKLPQGGVINAMRLDFEAVEPSRTESQTVCAEDRTGRNNCPLFLRIIAQSEVMAFVDRPDASKIASRHSTIARRCWVKDNEGIHHFESMNQLALWAGQPNSYRIVKRSNGMQWRWHGMDIGYTDPPPEKDLSLKRQTRSSDWSGNENSRKRKKREN